MRKVLVIGIGAGNPDHLTIQAVSAMNAADVFFVLEKGTAADELVAIREAILRRFVTRPDARIVRAPSPGRDTAAADYRAGVADWHEERAAIFGTLIRDSLSEDQCGAFLVWGDPSLYDSTLRILDQVRERGAVAFEVAVIPGISSVQALAAAHRLPLNRIGEAVLLTTGRRLAEGMPADADSVVVLLDDGTGLAAIAGDDLDIYWGAYLGTADEVLVAGALSEVKGEILRFRHEMRAKKGWIMDTYMLRRRGR